MFYPHTCSGCGIDVINKGLVLCPHCIARLPITNFGCKEHTPVEKVFRGRLPFVFATSFLYFTKHSVTQRLLHQLKYRGRKEVGLMMGRMMAEAGWFRDAPEPVDVLVPLPLHKSRERRRGYNQAAAICEGIAAETKIEIVTDAVTRTSFTSTQTQKNRMQRWMNMSGRFELRKDELIRNRHVLLVDDVITTGATLEACGLLLLQAPGVRLSIASLAYTTL